MWQSLFHDLFESNSAQASSRSELLVLSLHFYNVSKEMCCSGLREEDPDSEDLIPSGWNRNTQVYSFRYRHADGLFFIKVAKITPTTVTVHALRSDKQGTIWTWKIPSELLTALETADPAEDYIVGSVLPVYQREILDKSFPPAKPRAGNSLLIEERRPWPVQQPWTQQPPQQPFYMGGYDPNFGASDLYPGGLMGPQHPVFQGTQQRRPPYRIDPLGPFQGFNGQPNPDHLPPPGGFGGGFGGGFI